MSREKTLKVEDLLKKLKQERAKRPEEKQSESHDESNWLVSYADMMTLLCGFFIMLFSMAKLDTPKYDSFKQAMVKQFGGEYVSSTKELAKFATQIVNELGMESTTIIKADSNGISIAFESSVFFDTLRADVSPKGKEILEKLIGRIKKRQDETRKDYKVVVEGHTDSRPVIGGNYPSNWELSSARAGRVVRLFIENGFVPNHVTAIGYADTHPQYPDRTPSGQLDEKALSKNRRVVVRILEPGMDAIPYPDPPVLSPKTGASASPSPAPLSGLGTDAEGKALPSPVPSGPADALDAIPAVY